MLDQLLRKFRRQQSSRASGGFASFWPFGFSSHSVSLDGQNTFLRPSQISTEEAANHSAAYASVRLLSETIAALPTVIVRTDGEERRQLITNNLVEHAPNPFQSGFRFMAQLVRNVCLRGNAFYLIERDPDGLPMALWPVPAAYCSIHSDGGRLWYEVQVRGGERTAYEPSEVLHFALISDDGIRGLSILAAARRSIELGIEQENAGLTFFQNNARPSGLLHMPTRLQPGQAARLREEWEQIYSGRQRRTAILEEGMKFEAVGLSFEDSEWVRSRAMTGEDIARYFGVPPSMIGFTERSSYSSAESEWQSFLAVRLTPWLRMIEAELTGKLCGPNEEYFHDTKSLVRADTAARYAAFSQALQAGWMTVNEVRRSEGLTSLAGGDELRTPTWLQTQERAAS